MCVRMRVHVARMGGVPRGKGGTQIQARLALIILIMTRSEEWINMNTCADELLMSSHLFNPHALPLKEADRQRVSLIIWGGGVVL